MLHSRNLICSASEQIGSQSSCIPRQSPCLFSVHFPSILPCTHKLRPASQPLKPPSPSPTGNLLICTEDMCLQPRTAACQISGSRAFWTGQGCKTQLDGPALCSSCFKILTVLHIPLCFPNSPVIAAPLPTRFCLRLILLYDAIALLLSLIPSRCWRKIKKDVPL